MAVLLPHKFLFLGTPRSGSTCTHTALKAIPGALVFSQHISRSAMIEHHIGPYRGEFTFLAVRNPYDLLVTWWLRSRPKKQEAFVDFIRTYENKHFVKDGRLFFLVEDDMEIIRYETLQEDLDRVLEGLELEPRPLSRMNVTRKKEPWQTYYGPEEIRALNDRFGDEVERYGYELLDPANFPMDPPD